MNIHIINGPSQLLKDKDQFYWYFEGAGNATIEEVGKEVDDGSIFTKYLYYSAGEKRTGKNILTPTEVEGLYKGTWLTVSDNGNQYQGDLMLRFEDDGSASGNWTWKGVSGKWIIELRKK